MSALLAPPIARVALRSLLSTRVHTENAAGSRSHRAAAAALLADRTPSTHTSLSSQFLRET